MVSCAIGDREPAAMVAVMLTRRCNMTCAHCSVQSGPKIREEPTDSEILNLVHSVADSGLMGVQITGGEPMLREKLVFEILRVAKKRDLASTLSTNGFWGRKKARAWSTVRALKRAGLSRITVSYDRYHAEFQGAEPALNIARAAEWFDMPLNINVTRVANDPEIAGLVEPFNRRPQLKMRFYDVQTVGRARELPLAEIRGETGGFCNACCAPAVTDDGRMTACNGPAYFLSDDSPLVIGSIHDSSLKSLIEKHMDDPILETIRRAGPERLLRELEDAGVARELGIRKQHSGLCDLCIDINSNPAAVAVLRERLAAPRYQAELAARRMMIKTAQRDGEMRIENVNGPGIAHLWMDADQENQQRWAERAEKLIGRADFDWRRNADYVIACGVARAIAPATGRTAVTRWAPTFFAERVRAAALREGITELTQREVLRRVAAALAEIGETGVVLKGGAFMALEVFGGAPSGNLLRRAAGDIDVVVSPSIAHGLRRRLLSGGFKGELHASRTGPHHLAPLSLNGATLEIHTRIMPAFWGLPEREMLDAAVPLSSMPSLSTLSLEGMMLHALVHSTAHLFSHGMRAAWDCAWLTERYGAPDGERLLGWVRGLAMPRSFWVPARVLAPAFFKLPSNLMANAPADERQRRMEGVAGARLFTAIEGAFELNPISKNAVFLMLHDSYSGRARHIASLFGRDERESRKSAATSARSRAPEGTSSPLAVHLREGVMHWRQFQRSIQR